MYLNAKCSKELFLSDAVFLYDRLDEHFLYHKYKEDVNIDLALIYYREKRYAESITHFLSLSELSNEHLFKLAYANFSIDSLEIAQFYFSKLRNVESKFSSTAQYYFSYIAYEKLLYKSALEGFKKLLDDEKFGSIVPYYISQIYFHQKQYTNLISFAFFNIKLLFAFGLTHTQSIPGGGSIVPLVSIAVSKPLFLHSSINSRSS